MGFILHFMEIEYIQLKLHGTLRLNHLCGLQTSSEVISETNVLSMEAE